MNKNSWILGWIFVLASAPVLATDKVGLTTPNLELTSGSRWQGRVSFAVADPLWRTGLGSGFDSGGLHVGQPSPVNRVSLMGDYYFARLLAWPGSVGGFRATSGAIVGSLTQMSIGQRYRGGGSSLNIGSRAFGQPTQPNAGNASGDTTALPYLGLGYTGLSLRGGWSFNADMGMVRQRASTSLNSGRLFDSGQKGPEETFNDLRLKPLFQLDASFAF